MTELQATRISYDDRPAAVVNPVSTPQPQRRGHALDPKVTARVLLAEPDAKVREELLALLRSEGYAVDVAGDGNEVLWLADMHPYDLILMEVSLSAMDGLTVVRHLRRKNVGVAAVFLSERRNVDDRVAGLDAGADEYIVKPCAASELAARLRAVLRRERPRKAHVIRVGDLELDLVSRCASRAGKQIPLTNRESALLEFLMTNSPRPMSKAMIVERVWDQYFDTQTNVVNVYVNYLRKKIDQPGLAPLIHTMRGAGFALRA